MQAFKLNKLFVATALALVFGPGARVVDAASLCGIPGASQMGMGCGGNTGTADSTLVPNVGPAPQLPNGGSTFLPSGGGATAYQQAMAEMANNQLPQLPWSAAQTGAQIVGAIPFTVTAVGGCSSYTTAVNLFVWNGQYYQQGSYDPNATYNGGCGG